MTAIVHLDATILRPPVRRTDNGGRTYGMTTAVVGRGETAEFWKILVFGAKAEDFLGTNRNDLAALSKTMGGTNDWNRAKAASIFGPEQRDAVVRDLSNEQRFADTNTKVV